MKSRSVFMGVLCMCLVMFGTISMAQKPELLVEDYKIVDSRFTLEENPVYGGALYLRLDGSPQSFNFYGSLDHNLHIIAENGLFDGLFEENRVTGELEPALAKSYEVNDKEVILHLRDVKWSDGHPFTADDVLFTFEHFVLNKFAEGNSLARYTIAGELVKFEKVDDRTVKAILPETYGAFFRVLSHAKILPKHSLEKQIDPNDSGSVNQIWTTDVEMSEIVSTGPFALEAYIMDQKIVLTRNPYSWKVDKNLNPLPYLDKIEYLVIQDAQVASVKFLSNEIDYWLNLSPTEFPALKKAELDGKNISVFRAEPTKPTPSPLHIGFNFNAPNPDLATLFSMKEFRVAMEYALDRERIIDQVYNGLAVLGGVPVLPANKAFYKPAIENIRRPYDPEQANTILDELGLEDADGDGWREFSDGKKLEFTITTVTGSQQQDAAYIFSENLKDVGIKAALQLIDGSLRAQKVLGGDFEVSFWAFGNQPDPQLRKAIWQPGNPLYYVHFETMDMEAKVPIPDKMLPWEKEVFDVFEQGQMEMDPAKRKELYGKWQAIYAEEIPFIYVCKGMMLLAANKDVGNLYQDEQGNIVFSNETIYKK